MGKRGSILAAAVCATISAFFSCSFGGEEKSGSVTVQIPAAPNSSARAAIGGNYTLEIEIHGGGISKKQTISSDENSITFAGIPAGETVWVEATAESDGKRIFYGASGDRRIQPGENSISLQMNSVLDVLNTSPVTDLTELDGKWLYWSDGDEDDENEYYFGVSDGSPMFYKKHSDQTSFETRDCEFKDGEIYREHKNEMDYEGTLYKIGENYYIVGTKMAFVRTEGHGLYATFTIEDSGTEDGYPYSFSLSITPKSDNTVSGLKTETYYDDDHDNDDVMTYFEETGTMEGTFKKSGPFINSTGTTTTTITKSGTSETETGKWETLLIYDGERMYFTYKCEPKDSAPSESSTSTNQKEDSDSQNDGTTDSSSTFTTTTPGNASNG